MSVKYIGRTSFQKGKTLWEICGNLKNYGVGRIIVRTQFERYPEPSYFRILKATPCDHPSLDDSPQKPVRLIFNLVIQFRN